MRITTINNMKGINLNKFFLEKLEPYSLFCDYSSGLNRYFQKVFKKKEDGKVRKCVLLLEYEPEKSDNQKTSWLGIYYGVIHLERNNGLLQKEIDFIQRYYIAAYWKKNHPFSDAQNVFLIDEERSFGDNEYWDFWVNLRNDEPVEEACLGMMAIQEALLLCGFELVQKP